MRKFLLPFIAVLTAIGFSAFTDANKTPFNTETPYYWYEILDDETISGTPIDPSQKTMTEVMGGDCQDDQGTICLAGFETLVDEGEPAPSPSGELDNLLYNDN